jgi:hypothetical protein
MQNNPRFDGSVSRKYRWPAPPPRASPPEALHSSALLLLCSGGKTRDMPRASEPSQKLHGQNQVSAAVVFIRRSLRRNRTGRRASIDAMRRCHGAAIAGGIPTPGSAPVSGWHPHLRPSTPLLSSGGKTRDLPPASEPSRKLRTCSSRRGV